MFRSSLPIFIAFVAVALVVAVAFVVVGFGFIGREVMKRARPFEMRIIAHDPFVNAQTAGGGLPTVPSWASQDASNFGNTSAFGDWNGDGYPEFAVATRLTLDPAA